MVTIPTTLTIKVDHQGMLCQLKAEERNEKKLLAQPNPKPKNRKVVQGERLV